MKHNWSRQGKPGSTNKYYIPLSKGGKNPCAISMPNCVAYAYGRAYELLGKKPKLSLGNPLDWWRFNTENGYYPCGQYPKKFSIGVWENHVAVVEYVLSNKDICISQSHYNGAFFDTEVLKKSNNYTYRNGKLLGFIYLGVK